MRGSKPAPSYRRAFFQASVSPCPRPAMRVQRALRRPSALIASRLHSSTPPLLFGKGEEGEEGDPRKCPFVGGQNSLGDFNLLTAAAVVLAIVAVRMCLRRAATGLPHLVAWLSLPPRRPRALLAALIALPVVAAGRVLLLRLRTGGREAGAADDAPPAVPPPVAALGAFTAAEATPAPFSDSTDAADAAAVPAAAEMTAAVPTAAAAASAAVGRRRAPKQRSMPTAAAVHDRPDSPEVVEVYEEDAEDAEDEVCPRLMSPEMECAD